MLDYQYFTDERLILRYNRKDDKHPVEIKCTCGYIKLTNAEFVSLRRMIEKIDR